MPARCLQTVEGKNWTANGCRRNLHSSFKLNAAHAPSSPWKMPQKWLSCLCCRQLHNAMCLLTLSVRRYCFVTHFLLFFLTLAFCYSFSSVFFLVLLFAEFIKLLRCAGVFCNHGCFSHSFWIYFHCFTFFAPACSTIVCGFLLLFDASANWHVLTLVGKCMQEAAESEKDRSTEQKQSAELRLAAAAAEASSLSSTVAALRADLAAARADAASSRIERDSAMEAVAKKADKLKLVHGDLHRATAAAAQERAEVNSIRQALQLAEAAVTRLNVELEATKKRGDTSQV
jgi:hypothetical protein